MKEIEYKFLLKNLPAQVLNSKNKTAIEQFYFDKNDCEYLFDILKVPIKIKEDIFTIRLRIEHTKNKTNYVLNAKTNGKKERLEFEKNVSETLAKTILKQKNIGKIDKIRCKIIKKPYIFEFDEYLNKNNGLYICEVEVTNKTDDYSKICCILKNYFNASFVDVTDNFNFKNINLIKEIEYENNK